MSLFDGPRPRLFGHRGAAGVEPENTMRSFTRGLRDGAEYLEFDVHGSADDHVVVIHDETVDRTTNGTGAVKSLSLAELRRLDAGYRFAGPGGTFPARDAGERIPTLEEVLGTFSTVPVTIEVKEVEPPTISRIVDVVVASGAASRVILATAHDHVMRHLRPAATARGIPTNCAAAEVAEFVQRVSTDTLDGYRPPGAALQVPPDWKGIPVITEATVAAAHAFGLEVHAWTINDAAEMERLLTLGVDGIMSDFPQLGRTVLARRSGTSDA
jgi:glycerophosphoryl diester phosphodiesterase